MIHDLPSSYTIILILFLVFRQSIKNNDIINHHNINITVVQNYKLFGIGFTNRYRPRQCAAFQTYIFMFLLICDPTIYIQRNSIHSTFIERKLHKSNKNCG